MVASHTPICSNLDVGTVHDVDDGAAGPIVQVGQQLGRQQEASGGSGRREREMTYRLCFRVRYSSHLVHSLHASNQLPIRVWSSLGWCIYHVSDSYLCAAIRKKLV